MLLLSDYCCYKMHVSALYHCIEQLIETTKSENICMEKFKKEELERFLSLGPISLSNCLNLRMLDCKCTHATISKNLKEHLYVKKQEETRKFS